LKTEKQMPKNNKTYLLAFLIIFVCSVATFAQKKKKINPPKETLPIIGTIGGGSEIKTEKKELGNAELIYTSVVNQLDVSIIGHIQLYGDLKDGMILLPKFILRGKKVIAPKTVEFQFISYSNKKLFTTDRKLKISIDDKIIFEIIPTLPISKIHDDQTVTEVMVAQIPYSKFTELVTAKPAKAEIGSKGFALSAQQLGVLKDMKRCVDEGISFD